MRSQKSFLARKYAIAFLNVNYKNLPEKFLCNIKNAIGFLNNNTKLFLMFSLPIFSKEDKNKAINSFLKKFNLGIEFSKLFELLVKHERPMLFKEVLNYIYTLYASYSDTLLFNFISSNKLSKEYEEILRKFIEAQTKKRVIFESTVDESLLAGVRLQSNNLLWDYSVKSRLDRLKVLAIRG